MKNLAGYLHKNTLEVDKLKQEPTRNGFGKGLVEAADSNDQIVAVCADLAESTRMHWFQDKYPERYIEVGVAEQNLACVGSGLANYGKIPFITSYAAFSPGRNNEQIRTTISLNKVPVKIIGSHAGVSVGPDGATHQALEDIGLMRMQPNMVVISPCDSEEARKATIAIAEYDGPVYLRLARDKSPVFTVRETPFEIGVAQKFYDSPNPEVGIVATGALVHNAILAAKELFDEGISVQVVNLATIKPLDKKTIYQLAHETGAIVTVEEHQIFGGMGSAVAEFLASQEPVPIEFVGVKDRFGQSGKPQELIEEYELGIEAIKAAVFRAKNKKR